ncbi:hypothetical protein [Micromonospora sp. SH-82]|uniref:hypothetical protein n=1 Tax=Micromonospora sp. SH-82 TaxID=3132938 RepID=UPI003EC01C18
MESLLVPASRIPGLLAGHLYITHRLPATHHRPEPTQVLVRTVTTPSPSNTAKDDVTGFLDGAAPSATATHTTDSVETV